LSTSDCPAQDAFQGHQLGAEVSAPLFLQHCSSNTVPPRRQPQTFLNSFPRIFLTRSRREIGRPVRRSLILTHHTFTRSTYLPATRCNRVTRTTGTPITISCLSQLWGPDSNRKVTCVGQG
jgi:hypothetical protein